MRALSRRACHTQCVGLRAVLRFAWAVGPPRRSGRGQSKHFRTPASYPLLPAPGPWPQATGRRGPRPSGRNQGFSAVDQRQLVFSMRRTPEAWKPGSPWTRRRGAGLLSHAGTWARTLSLQNQSIRAPPPDTRSASAPPADTSASTSASMPLLTEHCHIFCRSEHQRYQPISTLDPLIL